MTDFLTNKNLQLTELDYKGVKWVCEYEHDPAIPGSATIFHLHVRDCGELCTVDLIDFIDTHMLHTLERQIEDILE
jgi:hypothetical protein